MMKMDTKLLETETSSLEEGPMKFHNSNEYSVLNETYRKTKCSRFFAILKVILYIELIIFVGWLGCVSLSQYNGDRGSHNAESFSSSKCKLGGDGCPDFSKVAGVDDENIELNSRGEVRSINLAVFAHEKPERSVNAPRRRDDDLAQRVSTRRGMWKSSAVATNEHPIEKRSVTADEPKMMVASCWSLVRDPELVEERRARLEAYTERNATGSPENQYTEDYMNAIDRALKATSISEIHFIDSMLELSPPLLLIQNLVANSSLELAKEGFEFIRDLYLEILELRDGSPEWEGYTEQTLTANISGRAIRFREDMDSAAILREFGRFAQIFNLRYDELQKRQNGDESNKPLFGEFVYLGEEPEKLGVRHLRRILDDFVKLYFRIQNPSERAICDPAVESNVGEAEAETPNKDKRSL